MKDGNGEGINVRVSEVMEGEALWEWERVRRGREGGGGRGVGTKGSIWKAVKG